MLLPHHVMAPPMMPVMAPPVDAANYPLMPHAAMPWGAGVPAPAGPLVPPGPMGAWSRPPAAVWAAGPPPVLPPHPGLPAMMPPPAVAPLAPLRQPAAAAPAPAEQPAEQAAAASREAEQGAAAREAASQEASSQQPAIEAIEEPSAAAPGVQPGEPGTAQPALAAAAEEPVAANEPPAAEQAELRGAAGPAGEAPSAGVSAPAPEAEPEQPAAVKGASPVHEAAAVGEQPPAEQREGAAEAQSAAAAAEAAPHVDASGSATVSEAAATAATEEPAALPGAPAAPLSWAARARVAAPFTQPRHQHRPPQRLPGQPPTTAPPPAAAGHPHGSPHSHATHYAGRGRGREGGAYGGAYSRQGYAGGRGRGRGYGGEDHRRDDYPRRAEHARSASVSSRSSSHAGGSPRHRPAPPTRSPAAPFSLGTCAPGATSSPGTPPAPPPAELGIAPPSGGSSVDAAAAAAARLLSPDDPLAALAALCCGGGGVAAAAARRQPRGIINPGHYCFANSVVQALMGTAGFCSIMATLGGAAPMLDASLPTLSALAALVAEFPPFPPAVAAAAGAGAGGGGAAAAQLLAGAPLSPALLADVVDRFRPAHGGGLGGLANGGLREQEDAHDFLEHLLDRTHQELLALGRRRGWQPAAGPAAPAPERDGAAPAAAGAAVPAAAPADGDGWLVQSGKRAAKRQEHCAADDAKTAVTQLFRGRLLSTVTCAGQKPSETSQPFHSLELHILPDSVRSVADALDALTQGEAIHGYKPTDAGPATTATKTVRLQRLPPVLVLYLVRFDPASLSKVSKAVAFEPRLRMQRAWLTPDSTDRGAEYGLVATVSHHGKSIGSGHYTADVLQPDGRWLRFDDSNVFAVSQQASSLLVAMATPFLDLGLNGEQQLDPATQREWTAHALRLGWDGVTAAAAVTATAGPLRDQDRCSIQPVDLASLLNAARGVRAALQAAQQRTAARHGSPHAFRQLSRLTIAAEDPAAAQAACASAAVGSYDLVAVAPASERMFTAACASLPCDLISLDLSRRLPFRLKPAAVRAAIARGLHFEIAVAPALRDAAARRQLFANALALCRETRGRSVVLTSGARSYMELCGPYDMANLGTLLGMSQQQAAAAVGRNAETVLAHAAQRRAWRGVLASVRPRQPQQPGSAGGPDGEAAAAEVAPPAAGGRKRPAPG
eukprot:scaffold2.g7150.t1